MKLADKIIELRKSKGMTQEELASTCNVSRQSISKWEADIALPELEKLLIISETFGVSGACLNIRRLCRLNILLRHSIALKQTTHAIILRRGTLKLRAIGGDTQLNITWVKLRQQLATAHKVAFADINTCHLTRELEGKHCGIVGGGHSRKISVNIIDRSYRRNLHNTNVAMLFCPSAARWQKERKNK